MPTTDSGTRIKLFYSYSHQDECHRDRMETALALLRNDNKLDEWHDARILTGQSISRELRKQMDESDIVAFLLSPDFIASPECMKEWNYVKSRSANDKRLIRIPIVVRPCAWLDLLADDDIKALPKDGHPVTLFDTRDTAWNQVYGGIKSVIEHLNATFTPKVNFIEEMEYTDFIGIERLSLSELFVFPTLAHVDAQTDAEYAAPRTIRSTDELLNCDRALISGEEKCGRTALARSMHLHLIEKRSPSLLIDLSDISHRARNRLFEQNYQQQFHGDYSLWAAQENKTIIFDNLTSDPRALSVIQLAEETFERIVVMTTSDEYRAYFHDEHRLAHFTHLKIDTLSLADQEVLIKNHLAAADPTRPVTHGLVDRMEDHVNSIVIDNNVVPRYAFYILSILQSRERYMPGDVSITSYGHCYQALIFANLVRSGVAKEDDQINACYNFAEHLAFALYEHRCAGQTEAFDFDEFREKYTARFYIEDALMNRVTSTPYGIVGTDGSFKSDYMYYYFLGKYLSGSGAVGRSELASMCDNTFKQDSYLTILFAIHHTGDDAIIDEILRKTEDSLAHIQPASLSAEETQRFESLVKDLPPDILARKPSQDGDDIDENRRQARVIQDSLSDDQTNVASEAASASDDDDDDRVGILRILKNNKIIGQVLRNRHGNLEKTKIEEIIQVVADSGLRLVNSVLADEEQIAQQATYIHAKTPELDLPLVQKLVEFVSFIWTVGNVELIVQAINVPAVKDAVNSVVRDKGSPAYDLIGYFRQLASAPQLTMSERDRLASLLRDHDFVFVRSVASLRTQTYINTHRSDRRVEQAVFSILNIPGSRRHVYGARFQRRS